MAEWAFRDRAITSRRQSFRRSLAEAGLADDALERLEQKRRQLDESIHKYIAAKEREYRSFEKDIIQRLGHASNDAKSTPDTLASPPRAREKREQQEEQQQNVVDALLSAGLRRENIGQPHSIAMVGERGATPTLEVRSSLAGLTDRRGSKEREKEFIGVFTPTYLPALENGSGGSKRADSAPPVVETPGQAQAVTPSIDSDMHRADSDSVLQAKQKRPIQLQLASRTSSSGSSADGNGHSRLTSALKSPTHPRPKRKRVSLAVGNTIVAPSDNVPSTLGSNNSTPSHSRTRSPNNSSPKDSPQSPQAQEEEPSMATTPASFSSLGPASMTSQLPPSSDGKGKQPATSQTPNTLAAALSAKKLSADGDLDFGLDDDDISANGNEAANFSQDSDDGITGRVRRDNDDDEAYESSEGPMHQQSGEVDDHAEHIEFHPGSVQRTNSPGYRRPSVTTDPVYKGSDTALVEHNASVQQMYGSTIRPQASFVAGSLGESFMASNAARMMRDRRASEQTQVRS